MRASRIPTRILARGAAVAAPLLVFFLAAACSSPSRFPEESREAEHAIGRAEDAGAGRHSPLVLESAKDTLEHARTAEQDAIRDKEEAKELHRAHGRLERATQRQEVERRSEGEQQDQKKVQELALDRVKEKQEDLRKRGLSEEEIRRLSEVDARALYERALHQARIADAESLDVKRLGLKARLTEM